MPEDLKVKANPNGSASLVAPTGLTREQYARAPKRAAYYWMAEKHGLTYCQEWDLNGTEHPLKDAGLILDELHDNSFISYNDVPIVVHAMAYRFREGHANYSIELQPLDTLIWGHIVLRSMGMFGAAHGEEMELLLFGRRTPEGVESVLVVDWDGKKLGEFSSVAEIYARLQQ